MCVSICVHMCDSRQQLDKEMEINNKWKASSRLPMEKVNKGWIWRGKAGKYAGMDESVVSIHFAF